MFKLSLRRLLHCTGPFCAIGVQSNSNFCILKRDDLKYTDFMVAATGGLLELYWLIMVLRILSS